MSKWCALLACALLACSSSSKGDEAAAAAFDSDAGAPVEAPARVEREGSKKTLPAPVTGPLNDGCAPEARAGHQRVTCKDETAFDVEVPESCTGGGCGVILDVPGWSMDGPMEDRHTRMRQLAGPKGFIVVQPTAPGSPPSWTSGGTLTRDFDFDATVWGFFDATMKRFGADPARIHMLGFSQGGMMTFRFLYAHGDVLASVAPIAGPDGFSVYDGRIIKEMTPQPPPAHAIPVMYTHGTKDRMLDFEKTALPLRDAVLKAYGLASEESISKGAGFRGSRWKDAGGRVMFEMWDHDFEQGNLYIGGHCLTGPIADGDGEFLQSEVPFRCLTDRDHPAIDLDLGAEILRFFTEHPKGS